MAKNGAIRTKSCPLKAKRETNGHSIGSVISFFTKGDHSADIKKVSTVPIVT